MLHILVVNRVQKCYNHMEISGLRRSLSEQDSAPKFKGRIFVSDIVKNIG